MRTTVAAAVAALALGLAGCSNSGQPSPPPTPDQPTTTSSPADTAPTTEAAPPTTESPSETASTDLPPEATEDSEAGAEAFARHYLDVLNALSQNPSTGELTKLSADACRTCANFEAAISGLQERGERTNGPVAEVKSATAVMIGQDAHATVSITQLGPETLAADGSTATPSASPESVDLVFRLEWTGTAWIVNEIQVAE